MTSNITACKYTPDAAAPLQDLSSDQVALLQQRKAHDISAKVGRIVQEYFDYQDDDVYNVKIQKTSITFDIAATGDHRTLTLNTATNTWELDNNGAITTLDAAKTFEVSDTVQETLSRIRTAWETNPASGGSSAGVSPSRGSATSSATPNVNVYINGNPVTTNNPMTTFQQAALRGHQQALREQQEDDSDVESVHVNLANSDSDDDRSLAGASPSRGRHRRQLHSHQSSSRSPSPGALYGIR